MCNISRWGISTFLLVLHLAGLRAQLNLNEEIEGIVYEIHEGQKLPLFGANIYWAGTALGTASNTQGNFSIQPVKETNLLVVSFTGFQNDTIPVTDPEFLEITLKEALELEEVAIVHTGNTTELSMLNPIKVERLGEGELTKAACCNLSESFETNPSVDVSFTDAVTGTKQIQMLGLAGSYTQITLENMPDIRGLSAIYGMEYIPGPWIESIQLNKGTGTVVNGFESMAGQINVELRQPETAHRLYLNLFGNAESRLEGNLNLAQKLNPKWSTALLLHGRNQATAMDRNKDGFMDMPLGKQLIALNRWQYCGSNGWESQLGIKGTQTESYGGQNDYQPGTSEQLWGMEMNTQRLEGWAKIGKVSKSKPYQSFGLQLAGNVHNQESLFGLKRYTGKQQSAYLNFIFQSAFKDTRHKYRTGFSLQSDRYDEQLDSLLFIRNESVPGVFFEYSWSPTEKVDVVAGLRGDYHNQYGWFATPRLHIRYAPAERTVFRFSAGRGQRTASILAENVAVLASSRKIIILGDASGTPYGLQPEVAWNLGANFTQKFSLAYRSGTISLDLYRTDFRNQIVTDLDEDPQAIYFYNLDGSSYSTSFQSQVDYELVKRLNMRLAYRWYDVKTRYLSGLQSKPLLSRDRAFANLAYATRNHLKFDFTLQWQGSKRLPATNTNPAEYQLAGHSPAFWLMNAQISKEWRERFELYLGGENLLNFKQKDPILAASDPFSPYFDSSMIWGPVFGRMVYGGIRLKLR